MNKPVATGVSILFSLLLAGFAEAATIGPDGFGYVATDETTFNWEAISAGEGGSGTPVDPTEWSNLDDAFVEVPIGFDFSFYGNKRDTVFISSNGRLTFGSGDASVGGECVPGATTPDHIPVFWDDLYMGGLPLDQQTCVWHQVLGTAPDRRFVVSYIGIPHASDNASRFTFQVVLYEDGTIKKQYLSMVNGAGQYADGRDATIGIEDNTGTRGLQWFCSVDDPPPGPVSNGYAIIYQPPETGPRILVLQEECGSSGEYTFEALNNLGSDYAYVGTRNETAFLDQLVNNGPWELIIVDEYSDCLDFDTATAIEDFIGDGGRAIISFWGWDPANACGSVGSLPGAFEASFASDYTIPQPLYRWDDGHPIFNTPNVVPDFTSGFADDCDRDGARFNAIGGGVAIGGNTATPQAGQHALIVGNQDRTILNGPVFSTLGPGVVPLIENEIVFLLGGQIFKDVTARTTVEFIGWRLDRQSGTYFATIRLCNRADSTAAFTEPFWFEIVPTANHRLWAPDGVNLADGLPYVDISAQVMSQLTDGWLDPGECVEVTDIELYVRDRTVPIAALVHAVWADPPEPVDMSDFVWTGPYEGGGGNNNLEGYEPGSPGEEEINAVAGGPLDVVLNDYNGDGASDLVVYDPVGGYWYIANLSGSVIAWKNQWGWDTALPVPGDYDGDGEWDLAVFDTAGGHWYIKTLGGGVLAWKNQWGWDTAKPVAGDYNGDGKWDLAVFDTAGGYWYVKSLVGPVLAWAEQWGWNTAKPVPGDYDGDGKWDLAVFDTVGGYWYIKTLDGRVLAWKNQWGWSTATPVPGDYDGDGIYDLAVYDTQTGRWYVKRLDGRVLAWGANWGYPGAIPAGGDYDGDGVCDFAVYDAQAGRWHVYTLGGEKRIWSVRWGWPTARVPRLAE